MVSRQRSGFTLDAGALIALERSHRRIIALLYEASLRRARLSVPATALAQVLREPRRQAQLMRLLRQPLTDVVPLGRPHASFVGQLLRMSGGRDIVDAHVAIVARERNEAVVTSDPNDFAALAPDLRLVVV